MKIKTSELTPWFAIILGILTVASIILRIFSSSAQSTKLELSLFSILQFLLSISFAWVFTRIVTKNEFMESQRKFAISAYRRIKEIDRGIERLLSWLGSYKGFVSKEMHEEIDVFRAITLGIRESIKSSIADWCDIIGEEIDTVEEIEKIRADQESLLDEPSTLKPGVLSKKEEGKNFFDKVKESQERLEKLISELPHSLQINAKEHIFARGKAGISTQIERLDAQKAKYGYVRIRGFWDSSLERNINEFSEGDILLASIGDVGRRIGALIAKDKSGKSVGVIINTLRTSYPDFQSAIVSYVGKSNFQIQLTEIDKAKKDGRIYFSSKIIDYAKKPWFREIEKDAERI